MFAVIKSGGKQYSIESGKKFKVEKVNGKKGDSYFLVFLVSGHFSIKFW